MQRMDTKSLREAAGCLRTLAHPVRLRMVEMLLSGSFTVGELAQDCGIAPHMASEHLSKMKDRGLLKSERKSRCIYYTVAHPGLQGILECIENRFSGRKGDDS